MFVEEVSGFVLVNSGTVAEDVRWFFVVSKPIVVSSSFVKTLASELCVLLFVGETFVFALVSSVFVTKDVPQTLV